MALTEVNMTIELREISLKARPKSLYNISPKGTVPVLQINKDNIIDESYDIMLWAIENSKSSWLNHNKENQLKIISSNDTDFKQWLDKYKYSIRYTENTIEYYQKRCSQYLDSYEQLLLNQSYLFGNKIQLTDIALFPFIRQCAYVDIAWFNNNFNNLSNWLSQIIDSSLFIKVMGKYKLWNEKGKGEIVNFNKDQPI